MSGLEALSVACNIMQAISFAHETISFCKSVYEGQSPDDHIEHNAASLSALSAQLQTHYESTKPQTNQEKKLADVAKQCNVVARALEEEVKLLVSHHAKGNLAQTLRLAVKTTWRRRRLERLEKSLRNYQHTMESYLLARVWWVRVFFRRIAWLNLTSKKTDAIELQQQQGFQQLDKDIQLFVSQYAAGHTKLVDLVKTELISVKETNTKETLRAEDGIKEHISSKMSMAEKSITTYISSETNTAIRTITQVTADSNMQATTKEQRYQFLQSLRFPAMNERRNNLIDSHEKTFRWVFGTDDCDVDYTPWDNFSDWLKSDCGIYWISGKPGSGKSTLIKYIIESPLTKSALDIWRAGPKILSHFFWKPGSKMQNNIKGLLCSILHQVFLFDTNLLDSTLATISSLLVKESDTDWSIKELKGLCFTVLDSYPSPLCIFLDGLDEVCEEDGPLALLKLVNDLSTLANIKICVASRSEPLLRSALCRYQQLRLQDLTRDDMRKYADAQISPYVTQHRISRKDGPI